MKVKSVSHSDACPHCHALGCETERHYIVVRIDEWAVAVNHACIVVCAGELMGLARLTTVLFSIASMVPVFIRFSSTQWCDRCEREYEREEG